MKGIMYLVFIPIFLFSLINCTSNSNLTRNNNSVQREYRFYEETGGFSLIIPVTWKVMDMPQLSKYKTIGLPKEKGFAPFIGFSIDTFNGQLDVMIDTIIMEWGKMYSDFELVQRKDFSIYDKLNGEKFIVSNTMYGQRLRQEVYCLPGKNNSSILIVCTVEAEAGDLYSKTFDNFARTFEWTSEKISRQESKRFFEEKGRFSLVPPEPWEATDVPESEYKVIRIRDENGLVHIMVFTMINYSDKYNLNTSVDMMIEDLNKRGNFKILQRNDFVTMKNNKGEKLIVSGTSDNGRQFKSFLYFIQEDKRKIVNVNCISPIQASDVFDKKFEDAMKTFEWMD